MPQAGRLHGGCQRCCSDTVLFRRIDAVFLRGREVAPGGLAELGRCRCRGAGCTFAGRRSLSGFGLSTSGADTGTKPGGSAAPHDRPGDPRTFAGAGHRAQPLQRRGGAETEPHCFDDDTASLCGSGHRSGTQGRGPCSRGCRGCRGRRLPLQPDRKASWDQHRTPGLRSPRSGARGAQRNSLLFRGRPLQRQGLPSGEVL
mmetsp:Transcript_29623/g.61174  ORF Transcript_29623/g.61174 Transcript_29623/m.61174 type:complete len:201 (-) Transcript_29623:428-1030(-)